MIVFGEDRELDLTTETDQNWLFAKAREKALKLQDLPLASIITVLDKVGQCFLPEGSHYQKALDILAEDSSFAPETNALTLNLLPGLLSADSLYERVRCELGNVDSLDRFVKAPPFQGKLKAEPLGILLHITAGNVFLSAIDSLIQGFLTKNISLLKPASANRRFPELVASAFLEADQEGVLSDCFAILQFQGGDERIENPLLAKVHGVIAWGGASSMESIKHRLPAGVRFLEFGPKISVQVISQNYFHHTDTSSLARQLAAEICLWDQAACASPQNLFLQSGIDPEGWMDKLAKALEQNTIRRGPLSPDQALEIHKEELRATVLKELHGGGFRKGKDYLIAWDPRPGIRPSGLSRTLIIKLYRDPGDLVEQISPMGPYLQSCSLAVTESERPHYMRAMAHAGVKRFSSPGKILTGLNGAPHDGRLPLRELVHLVCDEQGTDVISFLNQVIPTIPALRQKYTQPLQSLTELELTDRSLYQKASPQHTRDYMKFPLDSGSFYASGGTTGQPKFTYYSKEEFTEVAGMLAQSYRLNGVQARMVTANLFVAGNLWSSFLAVHEALGLLKTEQLPIGGTSDPDLILDTIHMFKAQAIFGLPSLLRMLADRAVSRSLRISIPLVFYAGEHLSQTQRNTIEQAFSTRHFASAGYASVDAGPIGWQCPHLMRGEHHLFSDRVVMEIIDEEAVITSMVKRNFPVLRYRTGDRVQWKADSQNHCPCGSSEPVFVLLDRVDQQFRFLSSTITWQEISQILQLADAEMQIQLKPDAGKDILLIQCTKPLPPGCGSTLYQHLEDLRSTVSEEEFLSCLRVECVGVGSFLKNPRTGKTPKVLDLR